MKLPRVTLDEFLSFKPCWLDDEQGRRRLRYYARKLGRSADALEILALRRIPAEERLWAVLRAEFIPAPILHEFACRCEELAAAEAAAWVARTSAQDAVEAATLAAQTATWAARTAAWAAQAATWATWTAARTAAQDAAEAAARNAQVDMLTQMLREYVGAGEEDTQCACMRV